MYVFMIIMRRVNLTLLGVVHEKSVEPLTTHDISLHAALNTVLFTLAGGVNENFEP